MADYYVRRSSETVHQRTRREEEELRLDEERRRQQEEQRLALEQQRAREEEEKEQRRIQEALKETLAQERLEVMRRAKEARRTQCEDPVMQRRGDYSVPGFFGQTCSPTGSLEDVPIDGLAVLEQPVGSLTVQLISATDLPQWPLQATDAYAVVHIGQQHFRSPKAPGCSPSWRCSFKFDVHRVDVALRLRVYRVGAMWGLLQDVLVGSLEVPFLDLEEWSGCGVIGRVLEANPSSSLPR